MSGTCGRSSFSPDKKAYWPAWLVCFALLVMLVDCAMAAATGMGSPVEESLAGQVMLLSGEERYAITPYVTLLEDHESQWEIADVVAAERVQQFSPAKQSYLNFGYSDSTFWIRLQVRYEPTRKRYPPVKQWYYEVSKAQLNMAELYIQRADGSLSRAQADIRIPYAERPFRLVNSVFPVTTAKGETVTLYLRVRNVTAFYVPLTLWEPGEYVRKTAREEILYGIFFGGMLVMIVYNLFLFVSIREPSYIYYSGYLTSALVFEAIDMGHGAAWIDDGLTWFNKEYVPIAIWCTWLTGFLFTRRFLEIPERHPLLNKFLTPLFIISLISAAFCFVMPFKLSLMVSVYFCGYMVVCMPLVGAFVWYKGNKNASFFTLAWLFNVAGFITYSSVATGRAPATPLFVASMPLGTLLEAVMLSFALAERIKRIQKEAIAANTLAMQHLAGYRSLVDNAIEGIYQATLRGRLISANPALARILGVSSVSALTGRGQRAITHLFDEPARQWRELLRGRPVRCEIERFRHSGDRYVAVNSAQLVRDSRGQPAYIEGRLVDITERFEREKAERERVRARREKATAEAMTQAKSQFLKNMSFDIRTSLAPIIGFSETLKEPTLAPHQRRQAIGTVTANAQQLLHLVNDILDYSKIEAGKMSIEQIEVDLLSLIANLDAQFTRQAQAKSLQFNVQYKWPLPPRITSDPTRLRQILQNLCENAIQHTYQGRVTLTIYWDAERERLCFAASDTGPGLSREDIDTLQSGNLAMTSASAVQRGGLSLAIVRELSRLLGGEFTATSQPGQGSTLTVSIGCHTLGRERWVSGSDPVDKKPSSAKTVPSLQGRVLLAEDNTVNQKLISRIIAKTGVQPVVVENGALALQAALEAPFDLVLMDINMPVMDGLEATRRLRNAGYAAPVYALTAELGSEEINACLTAGCNGHLSKPIEIDAFYAVMVACLPKQGATNG